MPSVVNLRLWCIFKTVVVLTFLNLKQGRYLALDKVNDMFCWSKAKDIWNDLSCSRFYSHNMSSFESHLLCELYKL